MSKRETLALKQTNPIPSFSFMILKLWCIFIPCTNTPIFSSERHRRSVWFRRHLHICKRTLPSPKTAEQYKAWEIQHSYGSSPLLLPISFSSFENLQIGHPRGEPWEHPSYLMIRHPATQFPSSGGNGPCNHTTCFQTHHILCLSHGHFATQGQQRKNSASF